MDWQNRIVTTPDTLFGRPRVVGTRIGVDFILELLASDWSSQRILDEYTVLTPGDLQAVFSFVRDCQMDETLLPQSLAGEPERHPDPAVLTMDWHDHIVCSPEVIVGKPTIKGTRLSVELILGWLAQGWTHEMLIEAYPQLSREDILAALAFAADKMREESYTLLGRPAA